MSCSNLITIIIIITVVMEMVVADELRKVCKGTSNGYSRPAHESDMTRYKNLEKMYAGCQYVETNLEIVGFQELHVNMTFEILKDIREVFGYVLIAFNGMKSLPLDNLRVVRGYHTREMYTNDPTKSGNFSFIVGRLSDEDSFFSIHMPQLKEISQGSVSFHGVEKLCYPKSINWEDVFNDLSRQKVVNNDSSNTCPSCHKSCGRRGCWSEKKHMCQEYNRINCDKKCRNRCVIGKPDVCCDDECSVGCSSFGRNQCFACKNVMNNGTCENECPRRIIYDLMTKQNKANPLGRYIHARQCIEKCPRDMFVEEDSCVTICRKDYKIDFDKSLCIPCTGDCHKSCMGQKSSLTAADLQRFVNCSVVHGSIHISDVSFNSDNAPVTMKDLKQLENVQLVTDFVYIQVNRSEVKSLKFLRNLRIIQGQELYDYESSLMIRETSLTEVGLDSLKTVIKGNIIIYKNSDLCYAHNVNWSDIMSPIYRAIVVGNKNSTMCESEGYICDKACTPELGCMGPLENQCMNCSGLTFQDYCLLSCYNFSLRMPLYKSSEKSCSRCHEECEGGCDGPYSNQCWACANFRWNSSCVHECPVEMIHNSRNECISRGQVALIGAVSAIAALILITVLIVVFMSYRKRMAKSEEKKLMIAAQLTGVMECEPLKVTDIRPNMAQLRLIKESELRCGGVVGSGAFGTVYKGLYIPEGENLKIPVAIKVLQCESEDENGRPLMEKGQEKEILDEAKIMASVVHPFCMHILAFCMGRRLMMVTQFMPQGCLLEYVQVNKSKIGSKHILNWCSQIAKGMEYLEERKIIHRDLAARNVLVQNPNRARITDFGLSKLVPDDDIYLSEGGKLPIKWLALECIREKIFTHQSDVWSFGVTVWEICTFGQQPYENIPMEDFVQQLEKGERLTQPSICTIDVFMIMIKCWLLDGATRPTFKELANAFTDMAHDPGRYLVIDNDELKRIPSDASDTAALLRSMNMGSREGLEKFVTADEYLQLKIQEDRYHDKIDSSNNVAQTNKKSGQRNSRKRPQTPLVINHDREVNHGHKEERYTPDPTNCSNKAPFEGLYQEAKGDGYNENADNYLIPRSRGQPQYLELINECDLNHLNPKTDDIQDANITPKSVQNLEYFGDQI